MKDVVQLYLMNEVITLIAASTFHPLFHVLQFKGEPGIDAGGLEREWFTLVVAELFSPDQGLFTSR